MFYVLSKILHFLTIPFVIIIGLFVFSASTKNERKKKLLFKIGLVLMLFFSNDFIANEAMRAWEVAPVRYSSLKKHYKVAIILSGFTKIHADYDDRIFLGLDRVTHAVHLYKIGVIEKFLISGGSGTLVKKRLLEADQIAQVLEIMGVSKDDILTESISRNTHESSIEVAKILTPQVKPEDCLLITSANHMRRSQACFNKVNFPAQAFSTDLLSHRTEFTFEKIVIPSTNALWFWQLLFKEVIGCIIYKAAGYI